MDTERMRHLARVLETVEHADFPLRSASSGPDLAADIEVFNMDVFRSRDTDCATAGCIAGWTCKLWPEHEANASHMLIPDAAAEILGLDRDTASDLFHANTLGQHLGTPLGKITPQQAADVVDRVARGWTPIDAWSEVLGEKEEDE